jgi:hypothetical protein
MEKECFEFRKRGICFESDILESFFKLGIEAIHDGVFPKTFDFILETQIRIFMMKQMSENELIELSFLKQVLGFMRSRDLESYYAFTGTFVSPKIRSWVINRIQPYMKFL